MFPSKYEGLPVTEINKRAYYYKHPSFTEIIISDGIESIGVDAFYACKNLRSVVMGNGVLSIGTSAFSGCSSLQTVVLSEDLQSIGNYAFKSCISLRQIDIPNNVISIKYSSFANTGITRIIIPESVLIIEHATFSSCSNLVSITLPSGITSISYDAFRGCSNLSIVNYCGSEEQWKLIDISDNGNYPLNDATIVYNYDPAGELGDQTTEESTKIDTSVETNDVEETPTAGETETGISE